MIDKSKYDPERYTTEVFDNGVLGVSMEVFISPKKLGGRKERTHYFVFQDKMADVDWEIELDDKELDQFIRKIKSFRFAKATR